MTDGSEERIAVIGLGYVGLPVALAFATHYEKTIGFDISEERIVALRNGKDATREVESSALAASTIQFTSDPEALRACNFFIIAVPTPIDGDKRPDLEALRAASATVGKALSAGSMIVYESTVYPGVTEEFCGPVLEKASGLRRGKDFKLGYSPERINPGDHEHRFENITKVVAAEDAQSLDRVAAAYSKVVKAGIHRAPNIKVAEAAKVIENTQRDLNIALMNELALICSRLGIRTKDVLDAAATKWNFLPFTPGLVGGHCIGVDPYYLTAKAESLGYNPHVILAGRRINDAMGAFIAQQTINLLVEQGIAPRGSRVGIFGVTFKENVPDLRNSKVFDIVVGLRAVGIEPLVHDPLADPKLSQQEGDVSLTRIEDMTQLDAAILAVPHAHYVKQAHFILESLKPRGVLVDIKSMFDPKTLPAHIRYWGL